MKCYDFEFSGHNLNSKGFIICKFGNDGVKTVSNGSTIVFNTTPTMRGAKHELTSTEYSDCLTTTFQICKNPCNSEHEEITVIEQREMMRWLNRKGFHKLKFKNEEYINIYFEASFNVSKIELDGRVYGFELQVVTNRPYALHEPISITVKNIATNGEKRISSLSDEEGYVYPEMEIAIDEDGDFELYNGMENRTMRIANCKAGEIIKINYPIIESSLPTHKIQNDFNWNFFRIANTFENRVNDITISIPCVIKMKYIPVVKVGF